MKNEKIKGGNIFLNINSKGMITHGIVKQSKNR
jgi:hypothetical protein